MFTDAELIFATRRPETSRSTSPSSVSPPSLVKSSRNPFSSLLKRCATVLKFKSKLPQPTFPKNSSYASSPFPSSNLVSATRKLRYSRDDSCSSFIPRLINPPRSWIDSTNFSTDISTPRFQNRRPESTRPLLANNSSSSFPR